MSDTKGEGAMEDATASLSVGRRTRSAMGASERTDTEVLKASIVPPSEQKMEPDAGTGIRRTATPTEGAEAVAASSASAAALSTSAAPASADSPNASPRVAEASSTPHNASNSSPSVASAQPPSDAAAVLALASQSAQQVQLEKLRMLDHTLAMLSSSEPPAPVAVSSSPQSLHISAAAALEFARSVAASASPPAVAGGTPASQNVSTPGDVPALESMATVNANMQTLQALNSSIQQITALNEMQAQQPVQPPAASSTSPSAPTFPQAVIHAGPSASAVKKSKKESSALNESSCQTVIECGESIPGGGGSKRQMTAHVDFFGKEVEIYIALSDPLRRHLYRASALAEKFGYATNKVGMYLARRRVANAGIYQATSFKSKPPGRTGLKAGGYFLTMDACLDFEKHFSQQDQMNGGGGVGGGVGGGGGSVSVSSFAAAAHASATAKAMAALMQQQALQAQMALAQQQNAILTRQLIAVGLAEEKARAVAAVKAESKESQSEESKQSPEHSGNAHANGTSSASRPSLQLPHVPAHGSGDGLALLAAFSPPPDPSPPPPSSRPLPAAASVVAAERALVVAAIVPRAARAVPSKRNISATKKRSAAEAQLHESTAQHSGSAGKQNRKAGGTTTAPPKKRAHTRAHLPDVSMEDVSSSRTQRPWHLSVPESKESFSQHQPGLSPLSPLSPSTSPMPGLPPVSRPLKDFPPPTPPHPQSASMSLRPRYSYDMHIQPMTPLAHQGQHATSALTSPPLRYGGHPAAISLASPAVYGSTAAQMLNTPYQGGGNTSVGGGMGNAGMMSPLSTYSPGFPSQSLSPSPGISGVVSSNFLLSPLPFSQFQQTPNRQRQSSGTHASALTFMAPGSGMTHSAGAEGAANNSGRRAHTAASANISGGPMETSGPGISGGTLNGVSISTVVTQAGNIASELPMAPTSPTLPPLIPHMHVHSPTRMALQRSPPAPGPALSPSMSPPPPMLPSLMQTG